MYLTSDIYIYIYIYIIIYIGYYSGEGENANDMRKALPRDKDKESIIPVPPITPDQLEW